MSESSQALLFLLTFLAARWLGPEAFGQYGAAVAFVGLFRVLADLGTPAASTLAASRDPSQVGSSFGSQLGLQILLCLATVGVCLLAGSALYDGVTWLAVAILSVELAARALQTSLRWVLRVFDRFRVDAIAMSAERLVMLGIGVGVLLWGGGVLGLVGVYAVVRAANTFGLLVWVRAHLLPLRPRRDLAAWRGLLREGLPLALSGACLSLVVQLDSVLLEALGSARDVGLYRAPLRITEGVMLVPRAVAAALLPVLPGLHARNAGALDRPYRQAARMLLTAGLLVALPGIAQPRAVVRIVFGAAYDDAAVLTPLLLAAVVPAFVAVLGETVLASIGRARAILPLTAGALVLDIVLSVAWIPVHGRLGAAAATLVTMSAHAILVAAVVARAGPCAGWPGLLAEAFASGALAAYVMGRLAGLPFVAATAVGSATLVAVALALALRTPSERARLRRLLRR